MLQFPASSNTVIAVGGTTLTKDSGNSRGWTETVWSGGGNGCSAYFPQHPWQAPHVASSVCSTRSVADVSAVSDPSTGVAVYNGGLWTIAGGTSVATPIIAAMYGANGVSPAPSASFLYSNISNFNDVILGITDKCNPPSSLCRAKIGFDGPTGLGTPKGAKALNGDATSAPSTTPSSQPSGPTQLPTLAPSVATMTPSSQPTTPTTTPTIVPSFSPTQVSYVYIGCYGDRGGPLRALNVSLGSTTSVTACHNLAKKAKYKYFALQYGSECRASASIYKAIRYGTCGLGCLGAKPNCNCNKPCPNGSKEKCGGSLANSVYAVGDVFPAIPTRTPSSAPSLSPST